MKNAKLWYTCSLLVLSMLVLGMQSLQAEHKARPCLQCHQRVTAHIVQDFQRSKHAQRDCSICHGKAHMKAEDAHLAKMPTVRTCKKCHFKIYRQYARGKHALAWQAMEALPMLKHQPKEITKGQKGCGGCHKIGELRPKDIAPYRYGVNACSTCHGRHAFSVAKAKDPSTCATCHIGFDHPQWEMWEHSKHGVAYHAKDGKQRAPACQTCHMSGGNHAVMTAWGFLAVRLPEKDQAWLQDRLEILKGLQVLDEAGKPYLRYNAIKPLKLARLSEKEFQQLRRKAIKICQQCHGSNFVRERFKAYDGVLREADRLMARAIRTVARLYQKGYLKPPAGRGNYPDVLDFYQAPNPIEQKLFLMWAEYRNRTYQGAFHDNWDYMHWYGWGPMKKTLVEIEAMARQIEKEHRK